MEEHPVHHSEVHEVKYKKYDWLIFLAGTAVTLLLLQFDDRFFWIAMPFMFTYLVKGLKMM